MKPFLLFLALGGALLLLASIAIGLMISISNNRPSWLLLGAFVLDSLILLVIAASTLRSNRASAGPGDSTRT